MTTTIIESEGSDAEGYEHICFLERTVPYLRPMSSMTEEEKKEYLEIKCEVTLIDGLMVMSTVKAVDWLNKNHFDYRGLIEKGLVIEVTEDNNPYED